jgi:hypothetical protein
MLDRSRRRPLLSSVLLFVVCGLAACGGHLLAGYSGPITMNARVEECRTLDRKVTHYGSLSSIGSFLSGGTGLAAALPDDKGSRVTAGIISLASGVFSAWANYLSGRNVDRFAARNCSVILNPNPNDSGFVETLRIQEGFLRPDTLRYPGNPGADPDLLYDLRKFRRDSLRLVLKASKDSMTIVNNFRRDSLEATLRALQDSIRIARDSLSAGSKETAK